MGVRMYHLIKKKKVTNIHLIIIDPKNMVAIHKISKPDLAMYKAEHLALKVRHKKNQHL